MAQIQLYIAASLDGYIARENGSVDWLDELPNPNQLDYGYADFYAGVDLVVMGRTTYEEVLGFDVPWPYPECKSYILTSKPDFEPSTEKTFILNSINEESINKLKTESQQNIWLVGGGKLVSQFLNLGAIDEIFLHLIPVVLGKGIPLFPDHPVESKFELVKVESFETGVVMMHYRKPQA